MRPGMSMLKRKEPFTISFYSAIGVEAAGVAAMPRSFAINSPRVMDSTGALELAEVPASMLIVGGGYIGLEMATVYAQLGSQISIVELMDKLLPGADPDLVKPLHRRLDELTQKRPMPAESPERMPKGVPESGPFHALGRS